MLAKDPVAQVQGNSASCKAPSQAAMTDSMTLIYVDTERLIYAQMFDNNSVYSRPGNKRLRYYFRSNFCRGKSQRLKKEERRKAEGEGGTEKKGKILGINCSSAGDFH